MRRTVDKETSSCWEIWTESKPTWPAWMPEGKN